ncbi:MAG TPA: hydroxymethylbilane synthase [Methanomassiliicoccales archaeon]|nr:hydroxymethylbilane synthase [Methanomassiliicoccales archaeon]
MIIGTRGSRLAMAQADMAVEALRENGIDDGLEIRVITTGGDRDRCTPLGDMGGYGVFTKELDQRLLSGEIDLAVNSLKDMPSQLTPGTRLAAVLPRGPVHDVLVSKVPLDELAVSAVVGTSSVRRKALLKHQRPDVQTAELRGNITTRLNKWRRGDYDAIILAGAGLERLGENVPRCELDPRTWVPPAGQGAVALVCRENDPIGAGLSRLDDHSTRLCVDLERAVMLGLGASCQEPLGVWAEPVGDNIVLRCQWLAHDGSWAKRFETVLSKGVEGTDDIVHVINREWGWPS